MALAKLHEHFCPKHGEMWEHLELIATCAFADSKVCPTCETVKVINLRTLAEQLFVGLSAREAVISAYAQSNGNYNTWEYNDRYGRMVQWGTKTVACGDFTAKRTWWESIE